MEIAKLFGSNIKPILLSGGLGNTYKSGNIVLKPGSDPIESNELAEIASRVNYDKVRIPKPIKSINNNWIEHNYVAWEYLDGKDLIESYSEKIDLCDHFSQAFKQFDKPDFIDQKKNSWHTADKVTWGELDKTYDPGFQNIINSVMNQLVLINLPNTIIHGDISGNIISDPNKGIGVIDLTLYWRPKDFSKAVLLMDIWAWDDAPLDLYNQVSDLPEFDQLLIRAGLRRIIENPENIHYLGKPHEKAIEGANRYHSTLIKLGLI